MSSEMWITQKNRFRETP